MSPSPEILVHVSAPSRAADDARYRRELRNLLTFQSVRCHELSSRIGDHHLQSQYGDALEQVADASFCSSSDPTSVLKGSRPERVNLELATPTSAFPNAPYNLSSKTPALVPGTTSHKPIPPLVTPNSPNRRPRTAPSGSNGSIGIRETPCLRFTQSDSWKTPPSVIPDSQPTAYSQKRLPPLSSPSPVRNSSPTTRKRQRLENPPVLPQKEIKDNEDEHQALSTSRLAPNSSEYAGDVEASSTPVAPTTSSPREPSTTAPIAAPFSTPSSVFAPSSLRINPPPPPTSTCNFRTHVTKTLAIIAREHLPLAKIYIPQIVSQTRQLDTHERGHWRINLTTFSEQLKSKFWSFLQEHVGKGGAGWGVNCALLGWKKWTAGAIGNADSDGDPPDELDDEDGQEDHDQQLIARVYCPGEIVGEIWNLLFIAGHREIKGIGVCWIDAWGNVVVRMK